MTDTQIDEAGGSAFNYQNRLFLLIAISTVIRICLASSFELGNTEAYYWVLSNRLQFNYFDHPPMVAWLIRTTTANGALRSELFVRSGAIITSGICTWLIYVLGSLVCNKRAGWLAAVLYSTSPYASLGIGVYIIPDSPQMIFWLSSLIIFIKLTDDRFVNDDMRLRWCLFGVIAGLCIMSKVHGIFIWVGALAYILKYERRELRNPFFYLSVVITLLIISPIIIWNLNNDFASIRFHSSRINFASGQIQLIGFAKRFIEVIFSVGPIHYVLLVIAVYLAIAGKINMSRPILRVLILFNLPLIIILLIISVFRETLPHWPGPPLSALLVIPAAWLTLREKTGRRKLPGVIDLGIIYIFVVAAGEIIAINYSSGNTSQVQQGMRIGANDATVDEYGWKQAARAFDSVYHQDIKKGLIKQPATIVVTNWIPAAHIDYYIAQNTGQQTYGLGNIDSLHQYYWLNKYKSALKPGDDAFYIIPSNQFEYHTLDMVANSFRTFTVDLMLSQYRMGEECKRFYVFRMIGFKGSQYFK